MKRLGPAAVLFLLAAASLSTAFGAGQGNAPPAPADARNCVPPTAVDATHPARSPSKPPLIRVCAGDSDTQLTLPWFLTDIIHAVNTHQSGHDLLRKMREDF
ncbi:hypothetical protein G3N57_06085 [Paraburkholderia sp. Se-20369]|nr:hypothetical protein [Paraburkholderia sp. Se-20369]